MGWKGGPFSEGTAGLGSKFEYIVQLEPVLQCEAAGEARKDRAEAESWWRLKMIPSKTKTQNWKFRARRQSQKKGGSSIGLANPNLMDGPIRGPGRKA